MSHNDIEHFCSFLSDKTDFISFCLSRLKIPSKRVHMHAVEPCFGDVSFTKRHSNGCKQKERKKGMSSVEEATEEFAYVRRWNEPVESILHDPRQHKPPSFVRLFFVLRFCECLRVRTDETRHSVVS